MRRDKIKPVRLSALELDLLQRAARVRGESFGTLVREAAVARALEVVRRTEDLARADAPAARARGAVTR